MEPSTAHKDLGRYLAACSLVWAIVACGPPPLPPLPADLAPLDEVNEAPLPAPGYPEEFNTVSVSEVDFDWAHGRGYIERPISRVWNALQDPDVLVDRRFVAKWDVLKGIDPTRAASWRVRSVVHDILTIDFDVEWRLDAVGGSTRSPEEVAGRARKVAGSTFINQLDDSVILRAVDDGVTLVELMRHSKTFNSGKRGRKENEQYLRDIYETLRERAHGRAFPVWN